MSGAARDGLGIWLTCTGVIGFFAGLQAMNSYLTGLPGLVVYIGALLGAAVFMIARQRQRRSWKLSLFVLLILGIIGFSSTFGILWYFTSYLPSTGRPFFEFPVPTIRPSK